MMNIFFSDLYYLSNTKDPKNIKKYSTSVGGDTKLQSLSNSNPLRNDSSYQLSNNDDNINAKQNETPKL